MTIGSNSEFVKYYVKVANTDCVKTCYYEDSITVEDFIYELQCIGANLLDVEYDMVEVAEAGQEIHGVNPENAPKMETENITMLEKYGSRLKKREMVFYLRKKQC